VKSLPPIPSTLQAIVITPALPDDGRCMIPRCRGQAKWCVKTAYSDQPRGKVTHMCERHSRSFAVNLGDLL